MLAIVIRGTQAIKLVRRPSAHHSAIRLNRTQSTQVLAIVIPGTQAIKLVRRPKAINSAIRLRTRATSHPFFTLNPRGVRQPPRCEQPVSQYAPSGRLPAMGHRYPLENVRVNLCTSYRTHFNSTMNHYMVEAMVEGGGGVMQKSPASEPIMTPLWKGGHVRTKLRATQ